MGMLKPLKTGGYLKGGFFGFPKSGKTYTAMMLAVGTRKLFDLKGPIAMFDTEGGSQYIANRVKEGTGLDLIGVKARSLKDLIATAKEAEREGISVLVVDSITHVWNEAQESYLTQLNKWQREKNRPIYQKLEFQHWATLKRMWSEWTELYLNSNLHIIVCGRAGNVWEMEVNENTGKKELTKGGTKMKTESEFGFEPSLLVEMERVEVGEKILHRATIIGDRFGLIDGHSCDDPKYSFFQPHVEKLKPEDHTKIDTTLKSAEDLDEEGDDRAARRARQRRIFIEEIDGELARRWPSTSVKDKQARLEIRQKIFGTYSEEKLALLDPEELKEGLEQIRKIQVDDGTVLVPS